MCVIEGDKVLVNTNDCPFELAESVLGKLSRQYPQVDLLMAVYAGAGPYPQCFKMSEPKKRARAAIKEKFFAEQPLKFAKALNAKVTMPFAGDYLLCGSLSPLNEFRGVPSIDVFSPDQSLRLDHGASWEVGSRLPSPAPIDQEAKNKYVSEVLSKKKLDYETDPMPSISEISTLIEKAIPRLKEKCKEMGFESTTSLLLEDSNAVYPVLRGERDKILTIGADRRLLKRILTRKAHWNTAEIGSHLTFDRRPDYFERGLHHMVSFLHA